jgi:palmitoyl transferase
VILSLSLSLSYAQGTHPKNFWQSAKQRLFEIWYHGHGDLYIPFYAWHNRFTYDSQRLHLYNEFPWGAGFGKGLWDEKGNWQGLYFISFLDSHKDVQPMGGYGHLWIYRPHPDMGLGLGFTLMVTARSDINDYMPFPGALPLISIHLKDLMVLGAYVPGFQNVGNVLFLMTKLTLD